jgi:hypothetical protein
METRPAVMVALLAALAAVATSAVASRYPDGGGPILVARRIGCEPQKVPAGAKLVVFGVYNGEAVSSAFIGSPDEETHVIDVTIEPGQQPLYLVLTSHESMVWRLSGATHRVARVLVSSRTAAPRILRPVTTTAPAAKDADRSVELSLGPAARGTFDSIQWSLAGVAGVPANRVIVRHKDCPRNFDETSGWDFETAMSEVSDSLGRRPDAVFGSDSARRVALPSGTVTHARAKDATLPKGFDPTVWREAARYWPGGLVSVDPASVVAKARVAPYRVLPSQMGLAQLVGAGAVQRLTEARFRIVKPIAHMPPGMGGAQRVKLILATGVPLPPGDPAHSCVVHEDGSEAIAKPMNCSFSRW